MDEADACVVREGVVVAQREGADLGQFTHGQDRVVRGVEVEGGVDDDRVGGARRHDLHVRGSGVQGDVAGVLEEGELGDGTGAVDDAVHHGGIGAGVQDSDLGERGDVDRKCDTEGRLALEEAGCPDRDAGATGQFGAREGSDDVRARDPC